MTGGKWKIIFIMAAVCLIQSTEAAVPIPSNWYADFDAGTASIHKTYPGTTKQSGATWNLDAGYRIFPFLGIEAGFTRYPNTYITTDEISASESRYSYQFDARGILPLRDSGVELYGKLGIGGLNSNISVNRTTNTNIESSNYFATSLHLGAGAQYYFLPNLALGIQWLYTSGNKQTGSINFYGGGVSILFG